MSTTLTAPWLLPPDEAERLHTLHHYASPACLYEPILGGFIDLAAQVFSVPIAFISLVDAEEVLCKTNLNLSRLERQPRMSAICALTIRYNAPVLFTDLAQPAQQGQLTPVAARLAQEHGVQFYASMPLRMPDQRPIGTLCLAGYQARPFCAAEQLVLGQLAELVEQTIIIRQMCLSSSWLGEEHWSRIQTTFIEGLWELAALARYLLKRLGAQVPVPTEVLSPVSRRLTELYSTLAVHPGSLL